MGHPVYVSFVQIGTTNAGKPWLIRPNQNYTHNTKSNSYSTVFITFIVIVIDLLVVTGKHTKIKQQYLITWLVKRCFTVNLQYKGSRIISFSKYRCTYNEKKINII